MQETAKLVLGIDLCNDITQVTVMRPHAAEPDAVSFDARTRKEYLPTVLSIDDAGRWSIGEEQQAGGTQFSSFLRAAVRGETVEAAGSTYSGRELLGQYCSLLLQKVRRNFELSEIGFVAITCEEAGNGNRSKELLGDIFENTCGFSGRFLVLNHMEAFLHFVIRQEDGIWKNGSAVFDYTTEGLLYYCMECRMAGGRRLLLADYKDYSEIIPPGFVAEGETERGALAFERLAGMALQQRTASLFVTGRGFEGEWVSDVLRLLSSGRRVFRGQNLYTQGACYAGAEVFRREQNVDFALLTPDQITVDVSLVAETGAGEDSVVLAEVGEAFEKVDARVDVLLDGTDKLSFRVLQAGGTSPVHVRVAPKIADLRGDRTNRYQVRLGFAKRDVMVIQLKELGFGEFYGSENRIYEEIVDFSQWEV